VSATASSTAAGRPGGAPTLMVNGIVRFRGDIVLGGRGDNRLAAIRFKGSGSLYARSPSSGPWFGSIELTSDLLPAEGTFPNDHRLGLISASTTTVGDWTAPSPPLRIAANVFANSAMWNHVSYQIAGAIIARYFYVTGSVAVYYVPALAGMPGVAPGKVSSPYFLRTVSWRDVSP
jgi:hypothetical protein